MRVLVNSLSAESLSGRHVLYGHLCRLSQWTAHEHEFHVLCNKATRPSEMPFGPNVQWHEAPWSARGWLGRTLWEMTVLPAWIRKWNIDLYFTPSGTVLPHNPVPQVSLAQNPWCLMPDVPKTFSARCKAVVQRTAYRRAQQSADLMIYNSAHMQRLYRLNAGGQIERRGLIVYQGIHDETYEIAVRTRNPESKERYTIVCVSVMARWKNCETLLYATRLLRDKRIPARLRLIGSWPDARYRDEINATINHLHLHDAVQIEGHVPLDKLHEAYRTAKVYCLLSRCESFGIPAIEAQAFGTPVVGSDGSAMPEIGGNGGIYVSPDDPVSTATALERLLTEDAYWSRASEAAIENASRFRWDHCSRPLLEMFTLTTSRDSHGIAVNQQEEESRQGTLPTWRRTA
jgi:glycosyltransferase involved in cell wall biosynthesis